MNAYRSDDAVVTIVCTGCGETVARVDSAFTAAGELVCRRCEAHAGMRSPGSLPAVDVRLPAFLQRPQKRSWGDFAAGFAVPYVVLGGLFLVVPMALEGAAALHVRGGAEGTILGAAAMAWLAVLLAFAVLGWRRGRGSFSLGVATSGGLVVGGLVLVAMAFGAGMARAL